MIELDRHVVQQAVDRIRFVDYAIGIFPSTPTKNAVKKALKRKELYLNGEEATSGAWINSGDVIQLSEGIRQKPQRYELDIEVVYEDDFLAVVNKPPGIPVNGNYYRTLENCLIDQLTLPDLPDAFRWALPAHRLDSPTSGLVIFAKTGSCRRHLDRMFQAGEISKHYVAILQGKADSQVIEQAIDEKEARSILETKQIVQSLQNEFCTLVRLQPESGRTHQLRKHCALIGNPIVGDKEYGSDGNIMKHKGLFLAAIELKFNHPINQNELHIKLKAPPKFDAYLEREQRRWNKFKS